MTNIAFVTGPITCCNFILPPDNTLSTTHFTWLHLCSNGGYWGVKPATNRLSNGTVWEPRVGNNNAGNIWHSHISEYFDSIRNYQWRDNDILSCGMSLNLYRPKSTYMQTAGTPLWPKSTYLYTRAFKTSEIQKATVNRTGSITQATQNSTYSNSTR
jgi:hypothetical protein